jgi:hypothetical protein
MALPFPTPLFSYLLVLPPTPPPLWKLSKWIKAWFWAFYVTDPTLEATASPPGPSGEPPKRGIKRRFSNAIDAHARPSHKGNERGSEFLANVAGWWKNIYAMFQVHSCYTSWATCISALRYKFRKCTILWSLFSYHVTNMYLNNVVYY